MSHGLIMSDDAAQLLFTDDNTCDFARSAIGALHYVPLCS